MLTTVRKYACHRFFGFIMVVGKKIFSCVQLRLSNISCICYFILHYCIVIFYLNKRMGCNQASYLTLLRFPICYADQLKIEK